MRFRRIRYPGKTLVVSLLQKEYAPFTAYFFKFWHERFGEPPFAAELCEKDSLSQLFFSRLIIPMELPARFFSLWWFLVKNRFKTLVVLNPELKTSRALRWAAFFARVENRAGFAPLRSVTGFNLSLPFNGENHHYVHQLKLFFEYITGEKTPSWSEPELPKSVEAATQHRIDEPYGIIALETSDALTPHLTPQLQKLINLATRSLSCALILRSSAGADHEVKAMARAFSEVMTERALAKTELLLNPTPLEIVAALQNALWVTGADQELLNVAALLSVPCVSVFGPLNERVWQPFSVRTRALTGDFSCRPCTAFPGSPVLCTNPVPWACVKGVSAELLWANLVSLNKLLTGSRNKYVP